MSNYTYLEHDHKDAFVDYPKLTNTSTRLTHECPKCQGHGGWNLRLNAYPLHGKPNTPENRHRFSHFRCSCSQCNGYGYVTKKNAEHIHVWQRVGSTGRCLTTYRCESCGVEQLVDSSD